MLTVRATVTLLLLFAFSLTNQEAALHALAKDASPDDPGHAFPGVVTEGNFLTGTQLFRGVGRAKSRRTQVNEKSTNSRRTKI